MEKQKKKLKDREERLNSRQEELEALEEKLRKKEKELSKKGNELVPLFRFLDFSKVSQRFLEKFSFMVKCFSCFSGKGKPSSRFTAKEKKQLQCLADPIVWSYLNLIDNENPSWEPPTEEYGFQGADDKHNRVYVHPPDDSLNDLKFGEEVSVTNHVSEYFSHFKSFTEFRIVILFASFKTGQ
jgi:hypothetical protein